MQKASPAYSGARTVLFIGHIIYSRINWCCYRALWFRARASDYRLREPGFESCGEVLNLEPVFCLYVLSAV